MSKSYFDGFIEKVKQGKEGETVWIPSPYDRLKNKIGVSKKMYTLLGGDPGTGKSAFVDTTYVLHSFDWYMKNKDNISFKPKIILRSMERSKEYRIAKWVCQLLFRKYNILIDVKTIFGMHSGDSCISKGLMQKIESCRNYIEKMQKEFVTVIDGRSTPTGVFKDFRDYALRNGTLYKHDQMGDLYRAKYIPENRDIKWNKISKESYPDDEVMPGKYELKYIPENDKEIVIPIVDHIGEYKNRKGWGNKQTLDKAGEYTCKLRDLYLMSPVDVCQFNRNLSDTRRRTGKGIDFQPEEQDFMGSSTMYQRCDIAIALFNPHKYSVKDHLGYPVQKFINSHGHNRFRSGFILKNTYGVDEFGAAFQFIGEIGMYKLLPKPDEIHNYKKYSSLEKAKNVIDVIKR